MCVCEGGRERECVCEETQGSGRERDYVCVFVYVCERASHGLCSRSVSTISGTSKNTA